MPTSNVNSTQQWDYPNCWPPLQAMVIQGLDRTNYKPAQTVAINLAKSWINTNYIGFVNNGTMFEKVIIRIFFKTLKLWVGNLTDKFMVLILLFSYILF